MLSSNLGLPCTRLPGNHVIICVEWACILAGWDHNIKMPQLSQGQYCRGVKGHLFVSLPPLSLPTLPLNSPCPYVCSPHTCNTSVSSPGTIPKANDSCIQKPTTYQKSTHQKLSTPPSSSARTLAASDEHQMHWDRSAWHYGILCCHVDSYLYEAWY
jgi:hypothetical protein